MNAVLANAPLAALWGPNPVPRAGGRCLDVVRLLRITTGSPVVEATSTRCQGVLDAFRGRAAAGRQLIDSARRSLTELGMRHALLEVDQFAGIVELVADDPAAAERHLRRAYNGFRRMGLDADTAETAALLARACLALDRDAEADELCTESEHLAGHALKASIAWRTVRAQLLARSGAHDEARRVAEEAIAVAERTDLLVDHGDACLTLATVLRTAGDAAAARAAAERAVELYELKGAAALAEKARNLLGNSVFQAPPAPPEAPQVELDNACTRVIGRLVAALNREDWSEVEQLCATDIDVESRRQFITFTRDDLFSGEWTQDVRRLSRVPGDVHYRHGVVAVRGERLALIRLELGTADVSHGAPQSEMLQLVGLDQSSRIALSVWFDLDDIDAALAELDAAHARFEEAHPRARRLENAASQVDERFWRYFAARDWAAMAEILTKDFSLDDRRHAVNAGIRQGRDAEIENVKVMADVGGVNATSNAIATRGERLALRRLRFSDEDQGPEAFLTELLGIVEINTDNQLSAHVVFDPDDIDAAFEELDARYVAGEGAAHAHTWSVISGAFAAVNRHELPELTSDWVNIDHRRAIAVAPGGMTAYMQAMWDDSPDSRIYIEAVHRLNDLGAVVTQAGRGVSHHGFDAEWRMVNLLTVEGELFNRCELFDEADIDAALARFDELDRPAPRLENAATKVEERFQACFAARDWAAMGEILADDISADDRRRVVNAGIRLGREAKIADMRATADLGTKNGTSTVIAIRGQCLALVRIRLSGRDQRPDAFHTEMLGIAEIDADNRMAARVLFDVDDVDAAFEELDARYLAGEAAAYAHTWSVIARGNGALNRREIPATTPDWANIDHRRVAAFAPGEGIEYIRAGIDLDQNIRSYVEVVHQLSDLGAVFTWVGHGTSNEGFAAEWRGVNLITVDGEMVNRAEVFDEIDLDTALAKFDELSRPTPRLENAASHVAERLLERFAARDWDAIAEMLADDFFGEDRRPVVGAGIRYDRDVEIASIRAGADLGGTNMTSPVIATRGARLILTRTRHSGRDQAPDAFRIDALAVVQIDAHERIAARIVFDPNDIDAALEELDARYLAGEAAAHAHTWSVITEAFAAVSRHDLPELTPDWVNVDHRRAASFAPGELAAYTRATWEQLPDVMVYVEAVHRLTDFGAVVTQMASGTSQEGFHAEWHESAVYTVEDDRLSRCELFDEADIDAALARFDELTRPARRLENPASQVNNRFDACFAARDWDAMAALLTDDTSTDDRRRVVNAGVRHGRDVEIESMRAVAEIGVTNATSVVIATREQRLALLRTRFSGRDQSPEAFHTEIVDIVEIDADNRITARVAFDPDDIDAAFEELDARYVAGETAEHSHTWSVISRAIAAFNRHELPEFLPDWVNIDHRRARWFAPGDLTAYIRATWDLAPDVNVSVEGLHQLSNLGAVFSQVTRGTSQDGFDAEWREIVLATVEGDLINRIEIFDEADIDAALARFDELDRPAPRLETRQAD